MIRVFGFFVLGLATVTTSFFVKDPVRADARFVVGWLFIITSYLLDIRRKLDR